MVEQEIRKVGIIAAPERAAAITTSMMENLPNQLANQINKNIHWEVDEIVDPLTGAAEAAQDILYNATYIKRKKGWDYAVCLTDLPIFYHKDIVAADISFNYKVAQISIPTFGWIPMQKRIEKTIIQLLTELHEHFTVDDPKNYNSIVTEKQNEQSITYLFKRQFPIMPIRRQENPNISFKSEYEFINNKLHADRQLDRNDTNDSNTKAKEEDTEQAEVAGEQNDNNIDVRFLVYPRLIGRLRLILGMTFANNPLKIMSSFKNVIAIAFTTGAFALIFPTIWNLSQLFSVYRLSGMMIAAILGLVTWIIIAHHLWEHPSGKNRRNIRRLYNLATTLTLIIDVTTYYLFMFVLFLVACLVLIPIEYFQSIIDNYDDVGSIFISYLRIAWTAASISTIVSAIGAGLENEELVRDITYGYRQNRRYEELNRHTNS